MNKIPNTDIVVSQVCLGTMVFGEQTSKLQSFDLLDMAFKKYGVNFLVRELFA